MPTEQIAPSAKREWRVALNVMGFALIAAFGQDFADRFSAIRYFSADEAPNVADVGTFFFALVGFFAALISVFAASRKQKHQLPWLHRCWWPYVTGVAFMVFYLTVFASVSPCLSRYVPWRAWYRAAPVSMPSPTNCP